MSSFSSSNPDSNPLPPEPMVVPDTDLGKVEGGGEKDGRKAAGLGPSIVVVLLMAAVLAVPFLMRPENADRFTEPDETLIIISPHNEQIRAEFSRAFGDHMEETTGKKVRIDWRVIGGTSEISRFMDASYQAAFSNFWRKELKRPPLPGVGNVAREGSMPQDAMLKEARALFLGSETSIGIDLFFGGGSHEFKKHAERGHLVPSGIHNLEPDWFTEDVLPATASGEILHDAEQRWVGACLSTFGICYNTELMARLGLDRVPERWDDLGRPAWFGQIALADPARSGSANKAFEMLIQQQLALEVAQIDETETVRRAAAERDALNRGWTKALNLIQRISANARYFSDSSPRIPHDVAQGNAAAGMSIDFYGRALNEQLRDEETGESRVQFITPLAGTSVSSDPVAMLRGAPNPELALEFIRFVLSPEGQYVWALKAGAPDGPADSALRRMPIRKDIFDEEFLQFASDPEVNPWELVDDFTYRPEWTGRHFRLIQIIISAMCLEPHDELQEAWLALIEADFPPRATEVFFDVRLVGYSNVTGAFSERLSGNDPARVQQQRRTLREQFRKNYQLAAELARRGE